jgi:nitrogen fixation protein NifZ
MRPEYDYGEKVRVLRNVRNDGTFPGMDVGKILVRRASVGYVRDIRTFLQDQIIYSVHFVDEDRLIGCREEELQRAGVPWTLSLFEPRDKVIARVPLGIQGAMMLSSPSFGPSTPVWSCCSWRPSGSHSSPTA